jgi:ABC-2 type transport system ATP-binding protein
VLAAPASDVQRVVDEAGLNSHNDVMVSRLSGGQHSRVSLAAALLGRPRLLVLDEPTVGLDPVLRRDLWDLFARIAATGTTLFVSSHVMDEATRCDRLVLMRDGAVLADDTHDALLRRTGTDDVEAAFLALVEGVRS